MDPQTQTNRDMHPITLFPGERRQVLESSAGDLVTYGAVHLNVTDLARSLVFWHELLGLQIVERTTREAHLGVPDATLIVLHAGAERRVQRGYSGIYHLAIHLPNEAEFARVLLRLAAAEYPQAPTDHVMSWATYLEDPDGIGLELSLETIDRFRGYAEDEGAGIAVIDNAGRRRSGVAPLDVEEVVSHLHDRDLDRPLPAGTRVGHVHLHVDDLQRAVDFYTESIGFGLNATLTRFGMADMSAGGDFPHRLAVNTWQGQGAPQPPSDSAGLRYFELVPRSRAVLDAITDRLAAAGRMVEERGQGFFTRDSAGNTLMLRKTDSAS